MQILGISLVIQIALVVHVLKTGRAIYWVYLIMFIPVVGWVAYLIVEVLPELSGNRQARSALRGIRKTLDPNADIRHREKLHQLSGSVDAARLLAAELVASGRFAEAVQHYEEALKGLYEYDPDLLLGLAQAQFGNEEFAKTRATLETLIEHNPDFRSAEGHLLFARSVEECGDLQKAEEEYKAVASYFSGAEAKIRYARLLEKINNAEEALSVYKDVVTVAELAPRHYRKAQKAWIAEARANIRKLGSE
jgi:hypothetical protein